MNINQNHASKDYIREYYMMLEDSIYALSGIEAGAAPGKHFLHSMIYHSRLAVNMCDTLLGYSSSAPLRDLAGRMRDDHSAFIKKMKRLSARYEGGRRCPLWGEEYRERSDRIIKRMFEDMRCADIRERINCDFIKEMLPHHEGGLRLCENALAFEMPYDVRDVAREMLSLQRRDISDLQRLHCMIDC